MSNVLFVSSCLETLKLKYIFAVVLSSIECLLHLKTLLGKKLELGGRGQLGENGLNLRIPDVSCILHSVCLY